MASLIRELKLNGSVVLEAYGHQVGGHHLLVKFNKDTICKPLITREHLFYESIPSGLRVFTPVYHGVITICLERLPSGEIKIIAYPRQNTPSVASIVEHSSLSCSTHKSIHSGEDAITSKAEGGDEYVNPWSAQCKKITRKKLKTLGDQTNTTNEEYVVLENLTSKYTSPSILDLKIGTRQHGDDVSEAKRYDAARNEYVFRDKYYGRSLSEEGFYEELKAFLHNGMRFRSDLLPNIIHMLEELQRVIEKQDSFRFFSSSLLIIYDGAKSVSVNGVSVGPSLDTNTGSTSKTDSTTPPISNCSHTHDLNNGDTSTHSERSCLEEIREEVDIRMIDFGHTTHSGICGVGGVIYSGPDGGYLLGLHSVTQSFRKMLV